MPHKVVPHFYHLWLAVALVGLLALERCPV